MMKEHADNDLPPKEIEATLEAAVAEPKKTHQTTYFESLIHLFKAGIGPGMFGKSTQRFNNRFNFNSSCSLLVGEFC